MSALAAAVRARNEARAAHERHPTPQTWALYRRHIRLVNRAWRDSP